MKASKTYFKNGQPKGAWIFFIKNNGERYAKPTFLSFCGSEATPDDVKARMERNNPGHRYEVAENQEELNRRFA